MWLAKQELDGNIYRMNIYIYMYTQYIYIYVCVWVYRYTKCIVTVNVHIYTAVFIWVHKIYTVCIYHYNNVHIYIFRRYFHVHVYIYRYMIYVYVNRYFFIYRHSEVMVVGILIHPCHPSAPFRDTQFWFQMHGCMELQSPCQTSQRNQGSKEALGFFKRIVDHRDPVLS